MELFGKIAGITAVFVSTVMFIWWIAFLLWNSIAANVFGAPELTYWQTAGALVLLGLLTGGFRAATSK